MVTDDDDGDDDDGCSRTLTRAVWGFLYMYDTHIKERPLMPSLLFLLHLQLVQGFLVAVLVLLRGELGPTLGFLLGVHDDLVRV